MSDCGKLTYVDVGIDNVKFKLPSSCSSVICRTGAMVDLSGLTHISTFELHALDAESVDKQVMDKIWPTISNNLIIDKLLCDYACDSRFATDITSKNLKIGYIWLRTTSNAQSDFTYLGTVKGVKTFSMNTSADFDVSVLSNFTELETLTLSDGVNLKNIDNLACTWITSLTIKKTAISSLKALKNFKNLEYLNLENNLIYDNFSEDGILKSNLEIIAGLHPNNRWKIKRNIFSWKYKYY